MIHFTAASSASEPPPTVSPATLAIDGAWPGPSGLAASGGHSIQGAFGGQSFQAAAGGRPARRRLLALAVAALLLGAGLWWW